MEKLYSLKELDAMRTATKNACVMAWAEATKGGTYKTAKELSDACDGLASPRHIANKMYWLVRESYCRRAPAGEKRLCFFTRPKEIRKTRHLAELDDNGNIIRRFDSTSKYMVKTYAVREESR